MANALCYTLLKVRLGWRPLSSNTFYNFYFPSFKILTQFQLRHSVFKPPVSTYFAH
jgi:hypothetical protein